ncbi:hypothetical protein [Hydrogenimonas sp. SS33]|uniref:YncE family protein n=1 Tax=Hydrogenimonas leucolamina TaxID=2954236 RepID=UPI00336BFF51
MKKVLFMALLSTAVLFFTGCGSDNADSVVDTRSVEIPIDTNLAYAYKTEPQGEKYVLYYADPRPEEHGLNRVIRIDYRDWNWTAIDCNGSNPHSIDRAGWSNKFYVRTQNSYSFDVVDFDTGKVKTVDMNHTKAADGTELYHRPRAIGAYNDKYKIQLLSVKNRPAVDVIDVKTDTILTVLGDNQTDSQSTATGHALWFDEDHCGVIDRVHPQVWLYRVERDGNGTLRFTLTQKFKLRGTIHALERVDHPVKEEDKYLFYATYEGNAKANPAVAPAVAEIRFDPFGETLEETRYVSFPDSTHIIDNVPPITHHLGVSPDGRYVVVPDFDGSVYFVDRRTFKIVKKLKAGLGAAHINFAPKYDVAIITSHFDQYVTIIDLKTLTVKDDVYITDHTFDPNDKHLLQPHFSYVDPDGRYFYTFATQDGDFVRIDLQRDEVDKRLHTGGAPEQAHS